MNHNKEELMKELIKKRANDELESDPLVTNPIWENEMLKEQIANTTDEVRETFRRSWDEIMEQMHVKNSPERKKRLMRLEKEHLVDMVFNLESRNEMLVNNLSEVEKMYNKLKEEKEE